MPYISKKQRDKSKKAAKSKKHKGLKTLLKALDDPLIAGLPGLASALLPGVRSPALEKFLQEVKGGEDAKAPLIKAPTTPGGGMVGSSKVIQGYKKGGQV